jgi:hypothetical protein
MSNSANTSHFVNYNMLTQLGNLIMDYRRSARDARGRSGLDLCHRSPKSDTSSPFGSCHSFCTTRRLPAQHQVIGAHCPEKGTVYMIGLWTKKKRQDTQVVANRFFSVVRSTPGALLPP